MANTISNQLINAAESVRAVILLDISMNINFSNMSKILFKKEISDIKKLHNSIYKYYN